VCRGLQPLSLIPESGWRHRVAFDEGQYFAPLIINPQKARRIVEAGSLKLDQNSMWGTAMRVRIAAHSVANPHDTGVYVATKEGKGMVGLGGRYGHGVNLRKLVCEENIGCRIV